ncbi:sensor histidine kinase [Actinoplanes sp. ATCC 53533]|uniref:sensor histidine kinase n=1 Tax=Actinoplanes sp. ATCC 53533 TaxID=1288362 RepID=UPI001315260C|nr:sensor histidine kinase [Actinoplanes sp. ATCC 53533]
MLAALVPGVTGLTLGTFTLGTALLTAGVVGAPSVVPLAALSLPVLAWLLWLTATHLHRVLTTSDCDCLPWRWTLAAREGERHRLQRDLHDGIGPALAGLRLRLDTAAAGLADEPDARVLIIDAATEAARMTDEVRRIIDDLRPLDLESVGLTDGIRRLVKRVDAGGASITVDLPAGSPAMSPETEIAAYRIVSECLTNTLRHSGARQITVRMAVEGDHLLLEVSDDGVGLRLTGRGDGTGLASITQRTEEIGGRCTLLTRPGTADGTLVRTLLPRFLA